MLGIGLQRIKRLSYQGYRIHFIEINQCFHLICRPDTWLSSSSSNFAIILIKYLLTYISFPFATLKWKTSNSEYLYFLIKTTIPHLFFIRFSGNKPFYCFESPLANATNQHQYAIKTDQWTWQQRSISTISNKNKF